MQRLDLNSLVCLESDFVCSVSLLRDDNLMDLESCLLGHIGCQGKSKHTKLVDGIGTECTLSIAKAKVVEEMFRQLLPFDFDSLCSVSLLEMKILMLMDIKS